MKRILYAVLLALFSPLPGSKPREFKGVYRPNLIASDKPEAVIDFAMGGKFSLKMGAVVLGVSEEGGVGTFSMVHPSGHKTELTAEGVANGDRTICGPVFTVSEFLPEGSWTITFSYQSTTYGALQSEPVTVEVTGLRN